MAVRPSLGRAAGLAALVLVALATQAVGAEAKPGAGFGVTERSFYLTDDRGQAGGQANVLLLAPEAPAAQQTLPFIAPGIDVLGAVQRQRSEIWFADVAWDKEREVVTDAEAMLHFAANPQGLAAVTVRLYDVSPAGEAILLAGDEREFVTLLSGTAVRFVLPLTGLSVRQGSVLALEVSVETPSGALVLQYGGDTPSGLLGVATRWLDSDGDGMPDSDEVAAGRNPLDPDEPAAPFADGDGDGLADEAEARAGTDPAQADSDGDGWGDGLEAHAGSDPTDAASMPEDQDADALPDNFEETHFGGLSEPAEGDPDGDGCTNLSEAVHGTDPTAADTDGDGVGDCDELADGTDPVNAASVQVGAGLPPEPVVAAGLFALGTSVALIGLLRRT